MKKFILSAAIIIAGCASNTGVVPMGDGLYMVSYQDNGIAAAVGNLKASALKDAASFCSAKGMGFSVVGGKDIPRAFGKMPQSEVQFKCV